jgi:outer membrane protein assembly factor BamB
VEISVSSSPAVTGNIVYVGSNDDYIYALDAYTGNLKWRYKTGGNVFSSPAVTGNIVYVGSNDDYLYALDADNGELKWRYDAGDDLISSPAISQNMVYTVSNSFWSGNKVVALDAETGEFRFDFFIGASYSHSMSSPALKNDIIYIGDNEETIHAFDINNDETKWTYHKINSDWLSTPAISGNTVYIGSTDDYVYALDANNGVVKWNYKTGGSVCSSPAASGNLIYIGSNDDYVYALDAYTGDVKLRRFKRWFYLCICTCYWINFNIIHSSWRHHPS